VAVSLLIFGLRLLNGDAKDRSEVPGHERNNVIIARIAQTATDAQRRDLMRLLVALDLTSKPEFHR
jgi:hypothetical protein